MIQPSRVSLLFVHGAFGLVLASCSSGAELPTTEPSGISDAASFQSVDVVGTGEPTDVSEPSAGDDLLPAGADVASPGPDVGPEVDVSTAPEGDTMTSPGDASAPPQCLTLGALCDDGDCCTSGDICVACEGDDCAQGELVCSGVPEPCDDAQPCTEDLCACEGGAPTCLNQALEDGSPCDYSPNDCTSGDSCAGGQCILSPPLDLDDDNPCTEDLCEKGEVVHNFLLTGQCDDGDECTLDDHCELGLCVGGDTVECVPGACESSASCVTGQGCVGVVLPVGAACDDGDACTDDEACTVDQTCESSTPSGCDDQNPCTVDSCDPTSGSCANIPSAELDGVACVSEASCTGQGSCASGVCVPFDESDCDDGNPCTDNWCDPELGCMATVNSAPCDDGDAQTCDDVCHDGQCVGEACEPIDVDPEFGDTCAEPIHLGDGGTFEVDLCDFNTDYPYGWCGMQGPELFFTLNVNSAQGQLQMSTEGSFNGIMVNYRWQTQAQCESAESYDVSGFCYSGPAGIGWGGYNPDDVLYFAVGSFTGECGPVVISATTVPTG